MTARALRLTSWDVLLCAVLAGCAALVHLPLLFLTAGGCDEWHVLQIAANLRAGELLYRDTNHIAGPVAFYGMAAAFAVFGERFEVGRVVMLALFSGLVVTAYSMTRRLTGPLVATLATLWLVAFRMWTFPHFHMMHYATVGLVLTMVGFALLHAERPVGAMRATAAGLIAGLAFTTKQDSGALGIAACLGAMLVCERIRRRGGERSAIGPPVIALLVAAATPFMLACAFFAWHGALGAYLWQTIYDPIILHPLYTSGGGPSVGDYTDMPPLLPLGQDPVLRRSLFFWVPGLLFDLHWRDILGSALYRDTSVVDLTLKIAYRLPYVLLAIEGLALLAAWRRLPEMPGSARAVAARAAALVFAAAMWTAFSKPRDWIHFSILLVPFVPIVARQIAAVVSLLGGWPRRIAGVAVAATLLLFVAASARLAVEAMATYSAPVAGAHGTVWVRPEDAASLGRLIDTMAATPTDRPVLVVPCLPIATFLPGRRPLSRFIWLWPRDAYADRDSQIIRRLEERPDASIVYVLMHTPFAPRPQAVVPDLYAYLAEHYRPVEVVGSPDRMLWALAGRRPPARDPAVRLTERLASARAARIHDGASDEVPVREVAGLATWPLTAEVLHVTPGRGGENRVMIPVDVPPEARLVLRAGVNPDLWQSLRPFSVRLRVGVVEDGQVTEVFSVEKDVYTRTADRLWTPVEVDLAPWAGKHVEVVLGVEALGWEPQNAEVAGFEEPRIELRRVD